MGEYTELQIKCSRCGTLNHVKATSPERSPVSDMSTIACTRLSDAIGKK
ncbi:Com family DNA-binding transcriptional regulator [Pseudomonas sp. MWU12-2029]|nr:Com family DNA-binding transcriptional regulator [Pseudomonas sp. MWU12-2029]